MNRPIIGRPLVHIHTHTNTIRYELKSRMKLGKEPRVGHPCCIPSARHIGKAKCDCPFAILNAFSFFWNILSNSNSLSNSNVTQSCVSGETLTSVVYCTHRAGIFSAVCDPERMMSSFCRNSNNKHLINILVRLTHPQGGELGTVH